MGQDTSVVLSLWSKVIHHLRSHGAETLTRLYFIFPWTFHSLDVWANKELHSITFLPPVRKTQDTAFERTSVSSVEVADDSVA